LTDQQVSEIREAQNIEYTSVLTLARRAAQYLALAQDYIINQGENAYDSLFFAEYVRWRQGQLPIDGGLLNLTLTAVQSSDFTISSQFQGVIPGPSTTPLPYTLFFGPNGTAANPTNPFISSDTPAPIIVNPIDYNGAAFPGVTWGENTFAAVAQGIATLTGNGKSGPFALVMHTVPFADTYAPVGPESLAITADRIGPLVKAGFYSSGTLPSNSPAAGDRVNAMAWNNFVTGQSSASPPAPPANPFPPGAYTGVLISIGGSSVELVVGLHARTRWQQKDANGNHRFRVLDRFTLKVSDPSAIVPLVFMPDL